MTTLRLNRNQMISSSEMARHFAEYLERACKGTDRLYVTRNNEIEAVLVGIEDFERLLDLEELVEHLTVARVRETRRNEPEVIDLAALLREEGLIADELEGVNPE